MKNFLKIKLQLLRIYFIIWIHKFKTLNYLYRFVFRLINIRTKNIHSELKKINFFNLELLQKPQSYYPNEYYRDNLYYGISFHLKNYAGYNGYIKAYIEHGMFFGFFLPTDEKHIFSETVICMGSRRQEQLKNIIQSKVISIGPFIHYADGYLEKDEFNILKNKLGRVLLLFPSHSIKNKSLENNVDLFIDQCSSLFENYDTIMVCLYWSDIKKFASFYHDKKIKVASAGNLNDSNFLSRLKTIIKLSDYVVSDTVGTHVGYCVYLNKVVWLIQNNKKLSNLVEPYKRFQSSDYYDIAVEELSNIKKIFEKPQSYITEEQKNIINDFWGLNNIKSAKELNKILSGKT